MTSTPALLRTLEGYRLAVALLCLLALFCLASPLSDSSVRAQAGQSTSELKSRLPFDGVPFDQVIRFKSEYSDKVLKERVSGILITRFDRLPRGQGYRNSLNRMEVGDIVTKISFKDAGGFQTPQDSRGKVMVDLPVVSIEGIASIMAEVADGYIYSLDGIKRNSAANEQSDSDGVIYGKSGYLLRARNPLWGVENSTEGRRVREEAECHARGANWKYVFVSGDGDNPYRKVYECKFIEPATVNNTPVECKKEVVHSFNKQTYWENCPSGYENSGVASCVMVQEKCF